MKVAGRGTRTHAYTTTIVLNLKQLHSTIFDGNANGCRAGIEAVFKEFF